MFHQRLHRLTRVAALALPAIATMAVSVPAAQAHGHALPDPIAHIAAGLPDPIAHMALGSPGCPGAHRPVFVASKRAVQKAVLCMIGEPPTAHRLPALREHPGRHRRHNRRP